LHLWHKLSSINHRAFGAKLSPVCLSDLPDRQSNANNDYDDDDDRDAGDKRS